ncbi:hypothetical protein [Prosthecobacter sp.]
MTHTPVETVETVEVSPRQMRGETHTPVETVEMVEVFAVGAGSAGP